MQAGRIEQLALLYKGRPIQVGHMGDVFRKAMELAQAHNKGQQKIESIYNPAHLDVVPASMIRRTA